MKRDTKPLDIMTKEAFKNGLTTVMALKLLCPSLAEVVFLLLQVSVRAYEA